ncbi:hypothetical protein F4802DRAFT_574714 [Xylaria palmicola]|nr:hypothetical protein F4802DRAFT_574714 [Xylaria palmicola]
MIQESTALIQTINQANRAECDKQNQGFPKPTGNTGWSCGGSSPCKWLALQEAETTLPAASSEQEFNHPNKAYSPRADYKYPIDTWVTVSKGSLQLFINGVKVREQGDGNFFIPAGTPNSSVRYKSPGGATLQFYGVCSKDTPCIGRELQEWKTGTTTTAQRDLVIDIGGYDYDVIFTLADTSKTTEQYSILVNGMQLDKTHGPLALGEIQKYDPANIPMIVVHDGKPGALECITHGGFWASIRIPAGTEKVTVHMDHYEAGWPYYAFAYRLDKVCQC